MLDKTPLEMALEREGQIEYCDECEYVRVVDNTVFCGLSGKLLHPMMFLRGQGTPCPRSSRSLLYNSCFYGGCKYEKHAIDGNFVLFFNFKNLKSELENGTL